MSDYRHSVSLDIEKCKGCTNCLKRCPTEAIRIRNGHACIDSSRCIDCGECIRVCPYKAKRAVYDKLQAIPSGKWKVALPAPTLYGQFDNLDDIDQVLQGLLDLGFDDVYEVACAAELVSDYTRRYLKELKEKGDTGTVISSACPVVTRLISLRYPMLCDRVLPILPPIEIAAEEARRRALERNPGLSPEDVFIVFISPCPAKVSYVKNRADGASTGVDLVVSVSDLYFELLSVMKKRKTPLPVSHAGMIGIGWASGGGEAAAILSERYLAADGIENVNRVLEEIDNGTFPDLEFVELNACPGGCVGGAMTVANPFIAKARLQNLRRYLPVAQTFAEGDGIPDGRLDKEELQYCPVGVLNTDRASAIRMMSEIEALTKSLPALDCGSCGAPTCRAFASDVVGGKAELDECIVVMREKLKQLLHEQEAERRDPT
jgi:iron only hydrogenase large subunit-like protein